MHSDALLLFLMICCGACWSLVYVEGIRLGLRDRSYAIPFWALALNLAWELLHALMEYHLSGPVLQVWISAIWFLLDLGILYTYLRFGRAEFPDNLPRSWFLSWTLLAIALAFVLQIGFVMEFDYWQGRAYAAYLQNLLMSVLFVWMLFQRGHRGGQSRLIALSKLLGTLAPTIMIGVVGVKEFQGTNAFILTLGLGCLVFDGLYLWLLGQPQFSDSPERKAFST